MAKKQDTMTTGPNYHRLTLRLNHKDFDRLSYWADKKGVSINEFVPMMLDLFIGIENGNYQLPTLEQARLNQLIDATLSLSSNVQSLESIVIHGFDSLLQLTKGDNYLLEHEEDGEF